MTYATFHMPLKSFNSFHICVTCRLIAFISLNGMASSQEVSDLGDSRNAGNARNVRNADL